MRCTLFIILLIWGCKIKQPSNENPEFILDFSKGPATLVYLTKMDYSRFVPVLLSEDKERIVAYPAIGDIISNSGFPFPTALQHGYYLDNRGINKNVAFLKLTYEDYSKLDSLPSVKEMQKWIIDKDPLIALCDCGSRKVFTDIERQLNTLIKTGKLNSVCHVLK